MNKWWLTSQTGGRKRGPFYEWPLLLLIYLIRWNQVVNSSALKTKMKQMKAIDLKVREFSSMQKQNDSHFLDLDHNFIWNRILTSLDCISVVMRRKGNDYHVAVQNRNENKSNEKRLLKKAFPEVENIFVHVKKNWKVYPLHAAILSKQGTDFLAFTGL